MELRTLQSELEARRNSAQSAEESASVSRDQYEAGAIDYLDVATTQSTSLSERQTLLSLGVYAVGDQRPVASRLGRLLYWGH
ncbi:MULTISPECIES: TolC family protein [unclassified Pseudomonas]|uniref:TolC family protein n=1 Tax=unclassified Pseudomonas TaxID=196821 RepID=UPI0030DA13B8